MLAGNVERLPQVRADGRVDGKRLSGVRGGVRHGADDKGWHGNGPAHWRRVRGTPSDEGVFLRVVEVGLKEDARVRFFLGDASGGRDDHLMGERCVSSLVCFLGWRARSRLTHSSSRPSAA
jgi:hypothetical protein